MSSSKNHMLNDNFPKHIKNATSTSDGLMSAIDKSRIDGLFEFGLLAPATPDKDGIMLKEDKTKLDGIEVNANNYIHPNDENTRHVTDEQISYWNSKASISLASSVSDGLMSSTDKIKLDRIEDNANNYIHPINHPAAMIIEDATHRFVLDEQIKYWDEKADKTLANDSEDGLMSADDKKKLNNIEENANNYIHPINHPATIITEDTTHRFVTDEQIAQWDSGIKVDDIPMADQNISGLMSADDKSKLDGIEENANNYVHPINHPATIITEDTTHRFVTDDQIAQWDSAIEIDDIPTVNQSEDGLMSADDKVKLDNIEANANNYTHPINHPATMIVEDTTHRFVTDEQIEEWNLGIKADDIPVVTQEEDGLMSADDKVKLDNIEANANNYKHPETHAATMIIEDTTHRFVTDGQIEEWNLGIKAGDIPVATQEEDGLMSADDKKKLNNIEDNANNYIHPETHNATMITEDTTHRFVTDDQIAQWDSAIEISDIPMATQEEDGLMTSIDKAKLDGIEENANNYIHPGTHAATMITEDTTHRFVTDDQIAQWDSAIEMDDIPIATQEENGLMLSTDKIKLDNIEENANNYIHPETHAATMIVEDTTHRFVTDDQITQWDSAIEIDDIPMASQSEDGLMLSTDKIKLDGIEDNANNYVHPETHAATMITEDTTHRFVTDDQIAQWDSAIEIDDIPIADQNTSGLMSIDDKNKLDGIEDNANNYIHPETHPATMITEDTTHRFVTDDQIEEWNSGIEIDDIPVATQEENGLISADDKIKLDGIEENANNYIHPETHAATMIVEDTTHRFVTDDQIEEWNSGIKVDDIPIATQDTSGLMLSEDKVKLDSIEENANNYVHPETHPATMITEDTTHRFVTDDQIEEWNSGIKVEDIPTANQEEDGLMLSTDKVKLDGIEDNANNYIHPETHDATMIVEDTTHRFVTDLQIAQWDSGIKVDDIPIADQNISGLMASTDKVKLDGIEENANNYVHPETHPATMIIEDTTHRFVTDDQIEEWNSGIEIDDIPTANQSENGLMSLTDKVKLDGIEENANNYTHPETHPATMINEDTTHRFVTDDQIAQWDSAIEIDDIPVVTREENGLMLSEDKVKLDGIEDNANNYTHPETHPATMITEDTTHRFVTDSQILQWDSGIKVDDIPTANQNISGLMSSDDKIKLDSIEENANNYTHPETHPATMITEDTTHRFVTDDQIAQWDSGIEIDDIPVSNQDTNGLMSNEDKVKLDGIESNANNYVHPETHPATMIVEDTTHRFVTDDQIEEWNSGIEISDIPVANQGENGLMSNEDKVKLDSIEDNANNYTHPETHAATMITEDTTHRFVTDDQIAQWDSAIEIDDIPIATREENGLISADDKNKLDSIEANANNYTHPETHNATMIVEDTTHRFVTDDQIAQWDSAIEIDDIPIATREENGLMVSSDKVKLDGIESNANNYIHPETHPATMIVEDTTHRFVTDSQILQWDSGIKVDDIPTANQNISGLMSNEDKIKLDGIEENANNYIHPENHSATMITEDTTHRFVTDDQIAKWDSAIEISDIPMAGQSENGLMSTEDKIKLDNIEENANNYTHPETHPATMIIEDTTHRFVTDDQIEEWNSGIEISDIPVATQSENGLMSLDDKSKLDGIEENANNYTHPETHPATMITEDTTHRFVTDDQIEEWNSGIKVDDIPMADQEENGLMSTEDKVKLDSIEENANNYTHPETHPATMITEDTTHRFVTDLQIAQWDSGIKVDDIPTANQNISGLMSADDKIKLDGIEENANNYTHPETHNATMIVEDTTHRFVTDDQIAQWDSAIEIDDIPMATQSENGLMSADDKKKLNNIAENANNYIHPETHAATMIVEDTTHRFVTDSQIEEWNSGIKVEDIPIATQSENGLMLSTDKVKLDNIAENANNYVHPETHNATMIVEDTTHRFVTDDQIAQWDSAIEISDIPVATQSENGLMPSTDKVKLDNIAENANNYIHPENHSATMIIEDTTHRFVTDDQIAQWDSAIEIDDIPIAGQEENGLMSNEDKVKLDGIDDNANNYIHPNNHPATMITEDTTHRFVTDAQIEEWNSGIKVEDIPIATKDTNGLMTSIDKAALDALILKVEQLEAKLKTAVFYK